MGAGSRHPHHRPTTFDQAGSASGAPAVICFTVCRGMQHAHTKGRVSITIQQRATYWYSHDGVPVPYVIDFGGSKALGQQFSERTVHTGFSPADRHDPPLYEPQQASQSSWVWTRADILFPGASCCTSCSLVVAPPSTRNCWTVEFRTENASRILRERAAAAITLH